MPEDAVLINVYRVYTRLVLWCQQNMNWSIEWEFVLHNPAAMVALWHYSLRIYGYQSPRVISFNPTWIGPEHEYEIREIPKRWILLFTVKGFALTKGHGDFNVWCVLVNRNYKRSLVHNQNICNPKVKYMFDKSPISEQIMTLNEGYIHTCSSLSPS